MSNRTPPFYPNIGVERCRLQKHSAGKIRRAHCLLTNRLRRNRLWSSLFHGELPCRETLRGEIVCRNIFRGGILRREIIRGKIHPQEILLEEFLFGEVSCFCCCCRCPHNMACRGKNFPWKISPPAIFQRKSFSNDFFAKDFFAKDLPVNNLSAGQFRRVFLHGRFLSGAFLCGRFPREDFSADDLS